MLALEIAPFTPLCSFSERLLRALILGQAMLHTGGQVTTDNHESNADTCTNNGAQQTGLESVVRDVTARLSQPAANRRRTGKFRGMVPHKQSEGNWPGANDGLRQN